MHYRASLTTIRVAQCDLYNHRLRRPSPTPPLAPFGVSQGRTNAVSPSVRQKRRTLTRARLHG